MQMNLATISYNGSIEVSTDEYNLSDLGSCLSTTSMAVTVIVQHLLCTMANTLKRR